MKPYNLGEFFTVEDCQRLTVSAYLKNFVTKSKEAVLDSVLEVLGTRVFLTATATRFGGLRYWFICPHGEERIGTLLIHPITSQVGCRSCLGLIYKQQRFKGMMEEGFI